jgi:hypothetical protein
MTYGYSNLDATTYSLLTADQYAGLLAALGEPIVEAAIVYRPGAVATFVFSSGAVVAATHRPGAATTVTASPGATVSDVYPVGSVLSVAIA